MIASEAALDQMINRDNIPALKVYRDSLQTIVDSHNDATGAAQTQIDKINTFITTEEAIPTDKELKVTAKTEQAERDIERLSAKADAAVRERSFNFSAAFSAGGGFERFHMGGVVPGPPGSEHLAILQAGERVIPAGHSTGGTGSGGGSATFNISVNVAPGGSPAETGAAVVDAIRSYERVAGQSWRAS
jgi:hypothetical protein